jgi:ribosomal protein S18 acetylase RimI-like enzyme
VIEVSRLAPGDAGRVLAAASLFDETPLRGAVEAYLADPANFLHLAIVDGVAAGFARGMRLARLDSERCQLFLYEIGVAETFRRRGVARALIADLLDLARAERCVEIFVLAEPDNDAALALYRATGGSAEPSVMFVYDLARLDVRRPAPS